MAYPRHWACPLTLCIALAACGDSEDSGDDQADGTGSTEETSVGPTTMTTSGPSTTDGMTMGTSMTTSVDESTGDPPPVDLEPFSDDFEDGDLDGWDLFQPELATREVTGGQLGLEPANDSLWFNRSTGPFIYKDIPGDFMATSLVTARSLSSPTMPPSPNFRLGGLMARNGSSGEENYVFIVVGADGNDVSVETKTTVEGNSTFEGPPWPSGGGELRICRVGDDFQMLIREPGGSWSLQDTFSRPDLPGTVQVGPVGYANNNPADLRLTFDYVEFRNIDGPADCMN